MKTQYFGRRSVHPGWVYQPRGLEWSIGKDEKGWGYINFYYVGTSWMSFISMVSTGPKWMLVVDKRSFYKRVCRGSFECSWKRFKRRQVVKWSFGRLTLAGKPASDTKQTLAKESRRANYTTGWFVHISWAKRRNEKEINWKSNEGYLRFCQLNLLVNYNNRRVLAGHLTIKTTLLKRFSAL